MASDVTIATDSRRDSGDRMAAIRRLGDRDDCWPVLEALTVREQPVDVRAAAVVALLVGWRRVELVDLAVDYLLEAVEARDPTTADHRAFATLHPAIDAHFRRDPRGLGTGDAAARVRLDRFVRAMEKNDVDRFLLWQLLDVDGRRDVRYSSDWRPEWELE